MYFPNEQSHLMKVNEMAEQIDDIFTELRLEYKEMAERYDEALRRIGELESEALLREEIEDVQV